ncbi:MAG: Gldg family protein [Lachnospiraceae bacterium]|jgi:ABC-2 type transport system permease protein|nr:Gldg family protein [Lachnospiraceae bacterium]MEE3461915.1 Gldg family protein [Lachnospiraceae bacterium]
MNKENENINEASEKVNEKNDEKKKRSGRTGRLKEQFNTDIFKTGAYTVIISVLVIAIVVVTNMIFARLDISADISGGRIYTLTETTREVVKNTDDNIKLYYMVHKGKENINIQRVVNNYEKLPGNIQVVVKDPVVYPKFAQSLGVNDEISDNDVIVYDEDTHAVKYISAEQMYYVLMSSDNRFNGETLDAEGCITAAIQFVQSGETLKMYSVTGHNERELGDSLINALGKINITEEKLDLLSESKVPDDCSLLLIAGPTTDYMEKESSAVLDYLKNGGRAIIFTEYANSETPNFDKILAYYGIGVQKGIIFETAGKYYNYINAILPEISNIKLGSDTGSVIMPNAEALTSADKGDIRSTVSYNDILTTSDGSFLKKDPSDGNVNKTDNDIEGPFTTGIFVSESRDNKNTGIYVFSSADLLDDEYTDNSSSLKNTDLFTTAAGSIVESKEKFRSVSPKDIADTALDIPSATTIILAIIIIILIPGLLLAIGFAIWFFRRKK